MMKRIIIHWTAGTHKPSQHEKECYHYLVDDMGKIYDGIHSPLDNLNCTFGNYAPHTGGGNTGSIGVSLCGMYGFKNAKDVGAYPITKVQAETMFQLVAKLCKQYGIIPNENTIMTHYEFGLTHPKTSSRGKIDIIHLPCYPHIKQNEVGDFIRTKVKWYYEKLN